jgi:23S rRNA pseudouridine1911/1915/1917 synthase
MKVAEFKFTAEGPPVRLDLFLSRHTGQSRVFVQTQIKKDHVRVNGAPATKAALALKAGDHVEITFPVADSAFPNLVPVAGRLEVLFEDDDFLAVNKEAGVVVHPAVGHRGDTLVHHLLHYFREKSAFAELSDTRPGIVHRLDKGTSGVILIAKNRFAQEELSRQFKDRVVKKEYECLVWGNPAPTGTIELAIGRHNWDRKKISSKSKTPRPAKTQWKNQRSFANFSWLAVYPHTGRTHQIRVHLSETGFPIVGDTLYETRSVQGKMKKISLPAIEFLSKDPGIFLHAKILTLKQPRSQAEIRIEAPRPQFFSDFLTLLNAEK